MRSNWVPRRRHSHDLPTTLMPKVTETRTQDHLREKFTHLNLANYPYDLEAIAKETGKPEDLKITYVLDKNAFQPRYELH